MSAADRLDRASVLKLLDEREGGMFTPNGDRIVELLNQVDYFEQQIETIRAEIHTRLARMTSSARRRA